MEALAAAVEAPLLVGDSPPFRVLKERLAAVACAERTTLISGPTGSGKDVVARALHAHSSRRFSPFVTVHCAALPETLIEAEMFGHSRGAFTGATQSRFGLIRSAGMGTLFLDEIDSLPLGAQAKLLRFLDAGEYRAVGSDRLEHSAAWVLAATNRNLPELVRQGAFRADLMFRLSVVQMDVPSLRERGLDVLRLASHFLAGASGAPRRFSDEARAAILAYDWPGNVRELKHKVESATVFSLAPVVDAALLNLPPRPLVTALAPPEPKAPFVFPEGLQQHLWQLIAGDRLSMAEALGRCEQLLVHAALEAEGDNRTRAAGRLGIHVRTLFKKLEDCSTRQASLPPAPCLNGQGDAAGPAAVPQGPWHAPC